MSKIIPHSRAQKGFTLIEMIVSLALFSIVVTTAVGALLALINANQQLQNQQGVMTNLSLALDSMTRELRTGFNYYCFDTNTDPGGVGFDHAGLGAHTDDCSGARGAALYRGVSFYEGGSVRPDARIMYYYDSDNDVVMRRFMNDPPQAVISSALRIVDFDFRVTGSTKLAGGDLVQPTVTISLVAQEVADPSREYRLQTTVTQRILDL